jgi:hypothetical protein
MLPSGSKSLYAPASLAGLDQQMSVFGWNDVNENKGTLNGKSACLGPFALAAKAEKPDPRRVPLRGELAHVGLAGRYFVPHYVVPQPKVVGDCGANLRAGPSEDSEIVYDLSPLQHFELLDVEGGWAWGCLGLEGPVGYVRIEELEDPSP